MRLRLQLVFRAIAREIFTHVLPIPTVRTFEQRLAALEQGERCIGTSSGMSAILVYHAWVVKGRVIILLSSRVFSAQRSIYLSNILPKYGITTTFVELTDYEAWETAITPETKLLFLETPSNPLTEIVDIQKVADIAHKQTSVCYCRQLFLYASLQLPLKLGADIVIHSATKYLDGQGRCVGGAIVGSDALLGEDIYAFLRTGGASMSPFNAWVFLKGLRNLVDSYAGTLPECTTDC